jgi:hypothetical protein
MIKWDFKVDEFKRRMTMVISGLIRASGAAGA